MGTETRRDFMKASMAVTGAIAGLGVSGEALAEDKTPADKAGEKSGTKTYSLTRQIPVEEGYDIVVAGGGPAGVAAAVCAARLGAKVFLAEVMGCLGGMGTSGLVSAYDPMANGKIQLVRGFMGEVVETMHKAGFMGDKPDSWRKKHHSWSKFNPEGYKLILDRKVQEAGVKVRFFTRVIEADADPKNGTVRGVITSNVQGMRYIKAKAFIDCTGDAVLSDLCGADSWRAGKDTPSIMPATMATLWSGESGGVKGNALRKFYFECVKKDLITHPTKKLVGLGRVDDGLYYLNGGHLFNLDACDADSLTEGAMKGRVIADDFRKIFESHPKMELTLAATSSLIGVRETRRIKGEYVFNKDDMATRRLFPDTIGVYAKACDIHPHEYTDEAMAEFYRLWKSKDTCPGFGEMFALPYGILVPKSWKNLWTAGRCVSCDVIAQGSLRCQPFCSQMGQAAGVAAVQALQHGETADSLDTERLVKTLRKQNVYLPQEKLSAKMTRS